MEETRLGDHTSRNTAIQPQADARDRSGIGTGREIPEKPKPTAQERSPAGTRARANSQNETPRRDITKERKTSPGKANPDASLQEIDPEIEYPPKPQTYKAASGNESGPGNEENPDEQLVADGGDIEAQESSAREISDANRTRRRRKESATEKASRKAPTQTVEPPIDTGRQKRRRGRKNKHREDMQTLQKERIPLSP